VDLLTGVLLLGGLIPFILSLQLDKRRHPWLPGLGGGVSEGLDAWLTPISFTVGVLVLALFVRRNRRSEHPILDFSLFRNDVFRVANLTSFFFGAAFIAVSIFLPLYLVYVLGVSATRAGAALIPFSLGIVVSATLAGQVVDRIGYRRQIFVGGLLFLVSVVLLATMGDDVPYLRVTAYMVMAGLGVGPGMPLFTLAVQNAVDVRFIGQATSAAQFFRQMGATVGAALMGAVLGTTLGGAFATIELPEEVLAAPDVSMESLVSSGGVELPEAIRAAYAERAGDVDAPEAEKLLAEGERRAQEVAGEVRSAFARATSRIYWLTAFIVLIAVGMTLRIPELALRTTHDRAEAARGPPE
jgi:MFS family permease